ncbi:DNA internalization-related competence protein ComEC/Rec2 [Lactococcus termiticola]|uniref:Competence protein ComEC n=1 Tax=Lactococcus termiticola TaxID=2169526 RepID=A0A2R5HJV8_9LACT|nr:DNA internalization-related competence protein ComEC/Rec2 [Lactococcus termiticola]GBG96671.1 competence protein ComEC [Lactococcus termiticola]
MKSLKSSFDWNKVVNYPWIYLVFLTVLLYFLIFQFSWSLLVVFFFLVGMAIYRGYYSLPLLLVLPASFLFLTQWTEQKARAVKPEEVRAINIEPDSIEVNGDSLSFRGSAEGQNFQAFYRLKSQEEQAFFKGLDQKASLVIEGEITVPEGKRNFDGFDYQAYLASQGIYRQVNIQTINDIKLSQDFDLPLLRRKFIVFIQSHFPEPTSSYMTGLLLGYLPKSFNEQASIYTSLGIIHLFALSGMQVNFFLDGLRKFLLRLGLVKEHLPWLLIPFSIFYGFMTGWGIAIFRALLQKNIPLRGLDNFAVAFFILLIFRPHFLLTIGGSLSLAFAFVLGMLEGKFQDWPAWKRRLAHSVALSTVVLPLLIYHFSIFQPFSILLTFAFAILFDFFLLPFLLGIFLLAYITGLSWDGFNQIFIALEDLVKLVYELLPRPIVFGKPSLLALMALLILAGLLIDHYKKKRFWLFLAIAFICLSFLGKFRLSPSITMVDIGQGDSFLLQDKLNRKNILIDTGGRVEFGQDRESWRQGDKRANADFTLIPYLRSRGISRLDVLLLTHADTDHVGDFLRLAENFTIKEVWVSPGMMTRPDFRAKLVASRLKVHEVSRGDRLPIFDSQLEVLSPGYTGKGDNNDSIVSYGQFYGKSFLFTGDLEKAGEGELLRDYPDLKVDVLKAGHHGSKGSSDPAFISAIQPEIALISAGQRNRYGHPTREVLKILDDAGVTVYRTDQQGAIRLDYSQEFWEIKKTR